ncbi:MAG: energy transducer TonB [Acidobacteriota bacterium]
MRERIDDLLEERRRSRPFARAPSVFWAAAFHACVLAAIFLAPRLAAQRTAPLEFVAVQIIPAQALGVQKPAPQAPSKPVVKSPVAPPEPEKPEPAPVMPEPAKKPVPAKPEKSTPTPPHAVEAAKPEKVPETASPEEPGKLGAPTASAAGTSAFGSAVALDNPDFTYSYYLDQMLSLIRDQWVRPPLGGGIEASVHFEVGRNGEIRDVRIVQSSGYSSFDLAALRAVQSASPLPPLPSGYKQSTLGVSLIVR